MPNKTRTTILAVMLAAAITASAQQALIDLTPGGYTPTDGLPSAYFEVINTEFYDEAAHGFFDLPGGTQYLNQWVSLFGSLNGGPFFQTNLFELSDITPSASIWWHFNFDPQRRRLLYVLVSGRRADGSPWEHIFATRWGKQKKSAPVMVFIDGMAAIHSISFWGTVGDGSTNAPRHRVFLLKELMSHNQ